MNVFKFLLNLYIEKKNIQWSPLFIELFIFLFNCEVYSIIEIICSENG